jgi:hypothetical protein
MPGLTTSARAARFFNVRGNGMKAPWRLFWVAFAVRLLYMTFAHTYRIRTYQDHFDYAWEAGRIARALVTGYGFSDPFANAVIPHTGPTAWLPPLYPLLVAAVFRLFGIYTASSAWILLAINCVFSALTAMAIWEIGARCFSPRVALWSGWLWALHPAAMQYAVRWIWETSITTCLFTFTLVLALRLRNIGAVQPTTSNQQPATSWALLGLLWGLIALLNSTLLLFLPALGVWLLIPALRNPALRATALRNATLALLIVLACIAPWTLRNRHAFHTFIPLRGNLGVELYMGDGPGSTGLLMEYDHPFQSPQQLRLYASLGEVRYSAMRGALARAYIKSDPAHFAEIVARRIYFFWISVPSDAPWPVETARVLNFAFISLSGLMGLALALHRRVPAAGLFAWAFLLLPVTYYLVTVHARFRHPLEPLLCIFGVYLFQSASPAPPPSSASS